MSKDPSLISRVFPAQKKTGGKMGKKRQDVDSIIVHS